MRLYPIKERSRKKKMGSHSHDKSARDWDGVNLFQSRVNARNNAIILIKKGKMNITNGENRGVRGGGGRKEFFHHSRYEIKWGPTILSGVKGKKEVRAFPASKAGEKDRS